MGTIPREAEVQHGQEVERQAECPGVLNLDLVVREMGRERQDGQQEVWSQEKWADERDLGRKEKG